MSNHTSQAYTASWARRLELSKLQIRSEYSPLNAVLMHRPGNETLRINPANMGDYLFDDVPHLPTLQAEHDLLADSLRSQGINVISFRELLVECLGEESFRNELLPQSSAGHILKDLPSEMLAEQLICGVRAKDLGLVGNHFLIEPLPNLMFMRDTAAVIDGRSITTAMRFPSRRREPALVRAVMAHHFHDSPLDVPRDDPSMTLEGGDIIVVSPKAVAIGKSERTTSESIEWLAARLFEGGAIERVYEVSIPQRRSFMHLDTVFSIIDKDLGIAYRGAFHSPESRVRIISRNGISIHSEPFYEVIATDLPGFKCIFTAGDEDEYASREQWSSGANLFAIAPRTVLAYERNQATHRALLKAGVNVIQVKDTELVRGRGGPRCLTLPLQRRAP